MRTISINWEYFEIGEPGDIFRDVSIISNTTAIAVGHTHHDTVGHPEANGAIWNGESWQVIDIYGANTENPRPSELESVFVLNQDTYWVAGAGPQQYKDSSWFKYYSSNSAWDNPFYVYSIWGRSGDDVYFGGREGYLVHWDGNDFEYVDTGMQVDIQEMDGNEETAFAVAWCLFGVPCHYTAVLQQKEGVWQTLKYEDNLIHVGDQGFEVGRYFDVNVLGDTAYFPTDYAPIVKYNYKTEEWNIDAPYASSAPYQYTMIAGSEWNDQLLLHEWTGGMAWFDGESVVADSSLINSYDFLSSAHWLDMEYDGETVYVVGKNQAAFVAVGHVGIVSDTTYN